MQDIFLEPQTHGTIYGLFASDEPLQIRYIGQTRVAPLERLRSHLSKSGRTGPAGPWFAEVETRNARVGMRILGSYPLAELSRAERRWIGVWVKSCGLLNSYIPAGYRLTVRPTDRFGGWSKAYSTYVRQRAGSLTM